MGKSVVEEALWLHKSRDAAQAHVDDLQHRIIEGNNQWEVATAELELGTAVEVLKKPKVNVAKKESTLGLLARHQLRSLLNSSFLAKKMNARALKIRIRECLRARKFELDHLEHSYHKQRSGM